MATAYTGAQTNEVQWDGTRMTNQGQRGAVDYTLSTGGETYSLTINSATLQVYDSLGGYADQGFLCLSLGTDDYICWAMTDTQERRLNGSYQNFLTARP